MIFTGKIFISAALFFFGIFALHVILWRAFRPRRHITWIFSLFLVLPFLVVIGALAACKAGLVKEYTVDEIILAAFLYYPVSLVYIQTYPAIQAVSPSLKIMYLVGTASDFYTMSSIKSEFAHRDEIAGRIEDMVQDGFIAVDRAGTARLTRKGRLLAGVFYYYRKMLGLEAGKG